MASIPDRIAAYVGRWAIRMLFGMNCEIDIRDEWPDLPSCHCIECDAKRVYVAMSDILRGK